MSADVGKTPCLLLLLLLLLMVVGVVVGSSGAASLASMTAESMSELSSPTDKLASSALLVANAEIIPEVACLFSLSSLVCAVSCD